MPPTGNWVFKYGSLQRTFPTHLQCRMTTADPTDPFWLLPFEGCLENNVISQRVINTYIRGIYINMWGARSKCASELAKSPSFPSKTIQLQKALKLSVLLNISGCGWKPYPGKRDPAQDTKCLQTTMIHSLGHVGPQTDRKVDYGSLYDWVYILLGATDHSEILPWGWLLIRSRLSAWTMHSCLSHSR